MDDNEGKNELSTDDELEEQREIIRTSLDGIAIERRDCTVQRGLELSDIYDCSHQR